VATQQEARARSGIAARFTAVSKRYGPTKALRGVDLVIESAAIHALVGENGAGKSTALGILAGRVAPSAGRVDLFGDEIPYGAPRALRAAGVVAIYQELTIAPLLSVEANVFLGQSLSRVGFLRERTMRARYLELCQEIGVEPKRPGTLAGTLSIADQQLLEIMRALVRRCRVILFDEPTASLAAPEREAVYRLLRTLRQRGIAIVFVSHNLAEVLALADTITVFREGTRVRSARRSEWSRRALVEAMLGESGDVRLGEEMLSPSGAERPGRTGDVPAAAEPRRPTRSRTRGDTLVRAQGVTVPGAIEDVSVEIGRGEIVGIAGLVGSGRSTLLRALAGVEPTARGRLWIDGAEASWPTTVRRARALGLALLPEDRKAQGLVLAMSAMDNVVLGDLGGVSRFGLLSTRGVERAAAEVSERVRFPASRLSSRAMDLSGGNQQKLLLARWRHARPKVLLADEPTRGVDIAARAEILQVLEDMAALGLALVVVSSELEELAAISHRVVVMSAGRVVGELDRADGPIAVADMLHMAFGTQARGERR
jgi:ABC-type sugar transport system ATPase subunit